jgi:hypothetical protein
MYNVYTSSFTLLASFSSFNLAMAYKVTDNEAFYVLKEFRSWERR